MIRHGDLYNMHQHARFMRPDAARYVRPDVSRWLTPPHPDEQKYSPDQPRDERGRWTDVGGGGSNTISGSPMGQINFGDLPNFSDLFGLFQITPNDGTLDGVQLAGDNGKPPLDSEGVLNGHFWDDAHRKYNDATRELSERFIEERGIVPGRMTPEQAGDLLREIRESENPKIRDFNRAMRILRRIFRGGRE